tara:strand:- start:389 stop:1123 length:735 start_codon:yes stop_codon:yes gene_type:complete
MKLKDLLNKSRINELDDNEGQMAKSQLERSMEYSKMIYDFMEKFGGDSDKLQFPAWVQSKLTKSMDYLQSVYNYLDGKDGLEDDPSALRKKQNAAKNEAKLTEMKVTNHKGENITKYVLQLMGGEINQKQFEKLTGLKKDKMKESTLNEDVFKSFLSDDPAFKLYTAKNTDNRKSVMARKTDKTWDDGVPVLKFIARAPRKDSPLPKGSFKIIEDNKHGWWYYQVGRTWYGIRQKDYGTPPFEY